MKITPQMIDGAVIQIRTALKVANMGGLDSVPQYLMDSAKNFADALDKWSAELKAQKT